MDEIGVEDGEQLKPLMQLHHERDLPATDYNEPSQGFAGFHRYDADFKWMSSEESAIVARLDWRILGWLCVMFFALQLDRGNIGQALSDNMLDDLGLDTNDYDTGQTIFFLAFIFAELPSQMVAKWIGPDKWLSLQMIIWSMSAASQAFMTGRKSFYLFRGILGIWEGGFIPSAVLFLSYFYTSKELPVRLSIFWTAFEATYIVAALLAYFILHLRGVFGIAGWQWLFAIEGIVTCLIGIASYFYLPPSPTQTASQFRGPDGWFTKHEEKIMINRILRDDPTKGKSHSDEPLTFRMLGESLADYDLWPIYLIGLTWLIPPFPISAYFTLLLREDGFDTFTTNLLTIPMFCVCIANLLFWTKFSEKHNERLLLCTISQLWCLPLLLILRFMPDDTGRWMHYILISLVAAFPFVHAILVGLTSTNAGSVRTRTVASAVYNMAVQTGNVIGSNVYREDDRPMYRRGNTILIWVCIYNTLLFIGAKMYYCWRNKRREVTWNMMTEDQKHLYRTTTRDKGNQRLDFRFVH